MLSPSLELRLFDDDDDFIAGIFHQLVNVSCLLHSFLNRSRLFATRVFRTMEMRNWVDVEFRSDP